MSGDSLFGELIDVLLPGRGGVAVVIYAYFDESFGPDGLLCVAGYTFTKKGVRGLEREWGHMLRRYGVPFFRMSACAHGNWPFDKMSKPRRDEMARCAIGIIKKYAVLGMANTVNEPEFNSIVPDGNQIGNARAYEFCVWSCLMAVRQWMLNEGHKDKVAYFFEAGHVRQGAASNLMQVLFSIPELKDEYHANSFAFVEKQSAGAIQAADLLAWQFFTDRKRELAAKPRRKDMASLLEIQNYIRHIDAHKHAAFVRQTMDEIAGRTDEAGQFSPPLD